MSHATQTNKSNVLLTELVIVILFFALTAATAMQLFVASHRKSQQNVLINRASITAQDLAEQLSGQGELKSALLALGFEATADPAQFERDEAGEITKVQIGQERSDAGLLVTAEIQVYSDQQQLKEGEDAPTPLCQMTAASYLPDKEGE